MKEKQVKFFETTGKHYLTIVVACMMLQIAIFISGYLFFSSNLIAAVTTFLFTFLSFLLFKDYASEEQKKVAFFLAKASIVLVAMSIINHLFISMATMLGDEKGMSLFNISYFLNVALLVGSISFFKKEAVKQAMNNFYEQSLLEKLKISAAKGVTLNTGDVILCVDKETKKNVILKYKDRFLHMLILGPTGSGKTSQTILPLIHQDMQNLDCGITVMEPKGDLAEKAYAMAEHFGRKAVYFNPILPSCPYFNPLFGKEEDVIENMATTFKMLNADSPQFFLDMNETLIRNALKVLKRLYGNKATLIELNRLVSNTGGAGRKMVTQFSRIDPGNEDMMKENEDITGYFLGDYLVEKSKTYEHCSGLRSQVSKITSNRYLRKVLNPPNGENDIDFDKVLEDGTVVAISTAQGKLRDLGRFLGYFLILQFQASVFRRPGNENTRRAHMLYIDEFQEYSNPGFAGMLTQGRSYRVASHLATQNRALIGMGSGTAGKDFMELVSTNARNLVIYPGGNAQDAKFYSDQFGEILKREEQKGRNSQVFSPLKGFKPMSYDSVSVKISEKMEARFSPSDLIYRPFGEITYLIISDNSIQDPGVGTIQYIPRELNERLDIMVEEHKEKLLKSGEHATPQSSYDSMDVENVVESDAVVGQTVVEAVRQDGRDHVYKGREQLDPNTEFTADFVLKEGGTSSEPKDISFSSEEIDELM